VDEPFATVRACTRKHDILAITALTDLFGARCRSVLTDHNLPNQTGNIQGYLYDTWDDGDAIYVAWNFEGWANRYMFADLNLHQGQSQYRSDAARGDTQIKVQRWQFSKVVTLNDPCARSVELRR
jgi:hypothetical protein